MTPSPIPPVAPRDTPEDAALTDALFELRGTWHVRHADGTEEDIVLKHGNLVEDSRGTCGQFILEWVVKEEPA